MNEDFAAIGDVITLVANEQPGEATTILNDLLGARISDSLQSRKQDIAKTLFAPSADALAEEVVQEEHDVKKYKTSKELKAAVKKATGETVTGHLPKSAYKLKEEIVQEEHESVEDFKKRGGKVKQIPAHKSYSAPKSQKIKVPFRMGKSAMREESEQLDEQPTRKHFQQVASIIKSNPDASKRQELANHHAAVFALQNPRFSHEKFHAAVGTKYK